MHRMLDDFAHEMETTESKLDSNMKKIAKVLHMSNGKNILCVGFSEYTLAPRITTAGKRPTGNDKEPLQKWLEGYLCLELVLTTYPNKMLLCRY